ncbi:MAG: gliding motility-associated C-terminal domain-containing protein [Chitinophagales bacterium]|nr:gliding motility-associated C-terminal domain-containing protein [Chitinophagales bacterium]
MTKTCYPAPVQWAPDGIFEPHKRKPIDSEKTMNNQLLRALFHLPLLCLAVLFSLPLRGQVVLLHFPFDGDTNPSTNILNGSFSVEPANAGDPPIQDPFDNGVIESSPVYNGPCGTSGGLAVSYSNFHFGDALRFTFSTKAAYTDYKWAFCDYTTNSGATDFGTLITRASYDGGNNWWYFNGGWGVQTGSWTATSTFSRAWQQLPAAFEQRDQVIFEIYKFNDPASASYSLIVDNFRIYGTPCMHPDRAALIELYEATDGDNWTTSWDTTSCDVCNWYGVVCDGNNRVTSLQLASNNLIGELPDLSISHLQVMNISDNQLSGSIPNFNIPTLQAIILSFNELSGSIPNFNLPNLRVLSLGNNNLGGPIPNFNLPNIEDLYIYSNNLVGSIPSLNLPKLRDFFAEDNNLSGVLPELYLPDLQFLYLHSNNLSGCFPISYLNYCTNISYNFSNNPLLPWEGNFSQFCNSLPQVGAPCDNVNTAGADEIQSDCSCDLACIAFNAPLSATTNTICNGESTDLTFNFTNGFAPYDVTWSGGTLFDINDGHVVNVSPSSTTTYSISAVTDNNGCTASGPFTPVTVTVVNPLSVGPITGALNVCQGATHTYSVAPVAGASSYEWTVPPGAIINTVPATGNTISVTWPAGASSGDICVAAVRSPCAAGPVQCIAVNFTPAYSATLSGSGAICNGDNTDITFNFTGGNTPYDVTWTGGTLNNIDDGHVVNVSPTSTTTYSISAVTDNNGCLATGPFTSVVITVNNPPNTNNVNGSNNACEGSTLTYSSNPAPGALSYTWTVPAGAVITGGQGSNSISVSWPAGSVSGDVCVTAENGCTPTIQRCRPITFIPIPEAPTTIFGPTETCRNNTETFEIPDVPDATGYTWTVPPGANITGGANTTLITVFFGPTATSGNVTVRAGNSCGNGPSLSFPVTVRLLPVAPVFGAGNFNPCTGEIQNYSVTAQASVDYYDWQLPDGGTVISGQGTPNVSIDWSGASGPSNMTVVLGSTLCNNATATNTRVVNVRPFPEAPAQISGEETVCISSGNQTYTAEPVSGATTYLWDVAAIQSLGQVIGNSNGNTITVNWQFPGLVTFGCKAVNTCGEGPEQNITVVVNEGAAQPGIISGPATVCAGSQANYSIAALAGISAYTWTVPAGASIISGQGSTAITVQFNTGSSGQICVSANTACGPSAAACLAVSVSAGSSLVVGAISGATAFCPAQNAAYSVAAVNGASAYLWTVPAGASISSGQNTNNISVNWGQSSGGTLCVSAIGSCGAGSPTCINAMPLAGAALNLGPDTTLCPGTPLVLQAGVFNTYNWSTGAITPTISVSGSGLYTVTVTLGSGNTCTLSDEINVSFEAQALPGSVSALITPANNAVNVSPGTALSWAPAAGCIGGYLVSIGTSPGGTDILGQTNVGAGTTFTPPSGLPPGTTVYVNITPYNSLGNGLTASFSFTTSGACTFVTSTADSGPGTLRAAILCANASPGLDTIRFAIPGAGPHIIQLLGALPLLEDSLIIDASTQPGWNLGQVIVDGTSYPPAAFPPFVFKDNRWLELYGLVVRNFPMAGFDIVKAEKIRFGKPGKGNAIYQNCNLCSSGLDLVLSECTDVVVQSNRFGIKEDDTPASVLNVTQIGVEGREVLIGGSRSAVEGNRFGNGGVSVYIWNNLSNSFSPDNIQIYGNDIGLGTANADWGSDAGIFIQDNIPNIKIGDGSADKQNRLANNQEAVRIGVQNSASNPEIRHNTFSCNTQAIVWPFGGPAAPTIANATPILVRGTASAGARVEVYRSNNAACPGAACQGSVFLGFAVANAAGQWLLNAPFTTALQVGDRVTATASLNGRTSAFSACFSAQTPACDPASDRQQLATLHAALNGPNWAQDSNWLSGLPLYRWHGISANNEGCVTSIILKDKNISGVLPDLKLPFLETIGIINSSLSGALPPFTQTPALRFVYFTDNELPGPFPDFKFCPELEHIDVDSNLIDGPIPAFNQLKKLKYLDVNYNQFSGAIPNFDSLTALEYMNLSINNFTGNIPAFSHLKQLEFLGLSVNFLSGNLPDFNGLNRLKWLYVDQNQLSGPLPALPPANPLQFISIESNRLTFDGMELLVSRNYDDFSYAPQDSVFHDTLLIRQSGQNLDFSLDFDANVSGNVYSWYKDGVFQFESTVNRLIINNLDPTLHAGVWQFQVDNQNAESLTLYGRAIRLMVNTTSVACPEIVNNGPFCVGEPLSVSVSNVAEFEWVSGPNGEPDPNLITSATAADAGTYFYQGVCFPTGPFSGSVTIVVNEPPSMLATYLGLPCEGNNVQLTVTAGGVGSFTWTGPAGYSSSEPSPQLSNLTPSMSGTYTIVVSGFGANTCTNSATVNLLVAQADAQINVPVVCVGQTLILNETGGDAVSWAWSGPNGVVGNTATLTLPNAQPNSNGSYSVTVTDGVGCTASATTLVNLQEVNVSVMETDESCGQSDGEITLQPGGSNGPFIFDWEDLPGSSDTQNRNGLSAGTYTVTVQDALGCTASITAVVGSSGNIPILSASTQSAACGQSNGAINISASGNEPLSFLWSNGATTQNLSGIGAGTYTVTVTDTNGCTASLSATVNQNGNLPQLTPGTISPANCGQSNGAINISASGNEPLSFLWSNGATTQNLSGIGAGTYTVTVTDANGCTASLSATVNQNGNLPQLTPGTISPANCGQSNGAITINASGNSPLSFLWSNNATTQNLSGIGAGTYTVTVTDANGCTASLSATVNQNGNLPQLTPGAISPANCGQSNGAITINASGNGPLSFLWSNNATTQILSGIGAGTYTVTVTDANGCTASLSATVLLINPPPQLVQVQKFICNGQSFEGYTSTGVYYDTLQTTGGCDSLIRILNLMVGGPSLNLSTISTTICSGRSTIISAQVQNCPACLYQWSDGSNNAPPRTVSPTNTQNWTLTLTDQVGCTASAGIEIQVLEPAVAYLEKMLCEGDLFQVGNRQYNRNLDTVFTLVSAAGCDSILNLKLQVYQARDIVANADTIKVVKGAAGNLPLLHNDLLPTGAAIKVFVVQPGQHVSTQIIQDTVIKYSLNDLGFLGYDSLVYEICYAACEDLCSEARVRILVQDKLPDLSALIANVITPNDDGVNDDFDPLRVYEERGITIDRSRTRLMIAARSGELVLNKSPYEAWNGRFNNDHNSARLPQGAYRYILSLPDIDGTTLLITGPVSVEK